MYPCSHRVCQYQREAFLLEYGVSLLAQGVPLACDGEYHEKHAVVVLLGLEVSCGGLD